MEEDEEEAEERLVCLLWRDGEPARLLAELPPLSTLRPRTTAGMATVADGCGGEEAEIGRACSGGVGLCGCAGGEERVVGGSRGGKSAKPASHSILDQCARAAVSRGIEASGRASAIATASRRMDN